MKQKMNEKQRGQSLVEFALITPVLLLLVMGTFDFGRALFAYATASNSARNALRFGMNLGAAPSATSRNYLDCAAMEGIADDIAFASTTPTITIEYIDSVGDPYPCGDADWDEDAEIPNGTILRITTDTDVQMITPFFPFSLPINFVGQRTIIKFVALDDQLVNPNNDTDGDGMHDSWETSLFGDLTTAESAACSACANPVDTDYDNDGVNDLDEYLNGTNPKTPNTPVIPVGVSSLAMGAVDCDDSGVDYISLDWSGHTATTNIDGYYVYANGTKVATFDETATGCDGSSDQFACFAGNTNFWTLNGDAAVVYHVVEFEGATEGTQVASVGYVCVTDAVQNAQAGTSTCVAQTGNSYPQITWDAVVGAVAYQVEFDGTVVTTVSGTTCNGDKDDDANSCIYNEPNNWGKNANHTWRFRADLGGGNFGEWSAPLTFTPCP
jgi:hypothetical protein